MGISHGLSRISTEGNTNHKSETLVNPMPVQNRLRNKEVVATKARRHEEESRNCMHPELDGSFFFVPSWPYGSVLFMISSAIFLFGSCRIRVHPCASVANNLVRVVACPALWPPVQLIARKRSLPRRRDCPWCLWQFLATHFILIRAVRGG